jgi:hypothetical protein
VYGARAILPVVRGLAVVVASLTLAAAAAAAAAAVERGTITVNRGAAGVTIGMTRAAVVAKLGQPLYQNANGYLQYAKVNLFDVYLDTTTNRVRQIGIAGPRFCTKGGVCLTAKGGLTKLKAQYGKALHRVKAEDGEVSWVVLGRYSGRRVFTSFTPGPGSRVVQVFIGTCPAPPTTCGA